MRDRLLTITAAILLVLGILLLVPFTYPITIALGTLCLTGFVVTGAMLLLAPSRLR